jgi:hypothetical protein
VDGCRLHNRPMPISWSDAIADADSSDAPARYQRALLQVEDLRPLVESYIQAVKDAGKWPMHQKSEWSTEMAAGTIYTTGINYRDRRCLSAWEDGSWWVQDLVTTDKHTDHLISFRRGVGPKIGSDMTPELFMTNPHFDLYMDAMDRVKDWLPRDLVAHLRSMDIPIPRV